MAVTASEVYKFNAEKLRQLCSEEGLDKEGPVRLLRQGLVRHLTGTSMASKQDTETEQASARSDLSLDSTRGGPQDPFLGSHVGGCGNVVPVIVELLRHVPTLSSEEPEAILGLITKLEEIHALGLVDDRAFLVRTLPLVSGAVLRFLGECLRIERNWDQCKRELLKEFFPHFVREWMIRDHVVFNFHEEGGAIRDYVDRVFAGARILEYEAEEEQLVARVLMNLHPTVLAHSAFLERPRTRKELINAVGLIEEKFSVLREREKTHPTTPTSTGNSPHGREPPRRAPPGSRSYRCWNCGQTGHMRRDCRQRPSRSGNGQVPRRSVAPRAGTASALRKVAATPPASLLWVGLNLKIGKIPALVDTGAQFSCVRSDVIDYLYHRGERCTFFPCTLSCLLADGSKAQGIDAVRLHVRLLSFRGIIISRF